MTEVAKKLREALLAPRGGLSLYGAIRRGFPEGDNSGPWCLDAIAEELAACFVAPEPVSVPEPVLEPEPAPVPKRAAPKKAAPKKTKMTYTF